MEECLLIDTGKTVRAGLFLMGYRKGGIGRILVLDMLSLKWPSTLNGDQRSMVEAEVWKLSTYKT